MSAGGSRIEVPRWLWITCGLSALLALIAAGLLFAFLSQYASEPFDAKAWRDNRVSSTAVQTLTPRQKMVHDLLAGDELRLRRPKDEVLELLGTPDREVGPGGTIGPPRLASATTRLVYHLRYDHRSPLPHYDALYIDFDRDGQLVGTEPNLD